MKNAMIFFFMFLIIPITATALDSIAYIDRWYAKQKQVSINEAVKQREIMNKANKIAQGFMNEKYSFSMLEIKHKPEFEIVFRVKRFKHCENKQHSTDKRCSLSKRIINKLSEENISQYSRILLVKYALADQKLLKDKATYYLHKFAKKNWSTYGWDHHSQTVALGIVDPKKFYRNLANARIKLPHYISVIQQDFLQ